MKTAVSVPDPVFRAAEKVARRLGMSRSELYAKAVAEFVLARGGPDVTAALDRLYAAEDSRVDEVLDRMQSASVLREPSGEPPGEW
ncbi:MAG: hypothetical protein HY608_09285 [Planctomycetes bacterium]|nr:hypothetical protein [Planctomycetota bacterium]